MLTVEEARQRVGEFVLVHSRACGRPHPGKLLEILGNEAARVQPGGHKHPEYVDLKNLSKWTKGEHTMKLLRAKHHANGNGNHSDTWISAERLLEIARPGQAISRAMINWWRKCGLIPDRAVKTDVRPFLYDVHQLRESGFFEKVAKREAVSAVRKQPQMTIVERTTDLMTKMEAAAPKTAEEPEAPKIPPFAAIGAMLRETHPKTAGTEAPKPAGKDRLICAIRNRAEAEALLHEARAEEARARGEQEIAGLP